MAHVQFAYGVKTLTANTRSFDCYGWLSLLTVASSAGENVKIGATEGTLGRAGTRGSLQAPLDWTVRGTTDIDGAPGGSYFAQLRANLAALHRWFDAAPGKLVTVSLVDGLTTLSESAYHVEFSPPDWQGRQIQVQQTVRVAAGLLS